MIKLKISALHKWSYNYGIATYRVANSVRKLIGIPQIILSKSMLKLDC
jgi:hypothetical protein